MTFLETHSQFTAPLHQLAAELASKSEQLNLFSAGDRLKLESKHFPDALAALDHTADLFHEGNRVLDLGTGGGIPGLVLATAQPDLLFTLCDAREKKIRAVLSVAELCNLKNVSGLWGRFEDLAQDPAHRGRFDLVVARAVAALPTLLEYSAGFLKVQGHLLAWKGSEWQAELALSQNALQILGLEFNRCIEYTLATGEARFLLDFVLVRSVPKQWPRKPDLPRSKPL